MNLKLVREVFTDTTTIGKLYINGVYECDTLEDKVRDVKIPNITAIPYGIYEVIVNFSNRFQQLMCLLLNVPNYEGIRIHWGNYDKDTDGCLLLGEYDETHKNFIGHSRDTYKAFMIDIKSTAKKEKIFIEITK